MNDGGMTVVFSPQGAWVCDETPLKPVGSIDLKRENRTFWMDLPRAETGEVERMMALRREVEQIAGHPVFEEKRQEAPSSDPVNARQRGSPGCKGTKTTNNELTHIVFRSWCRHCVSGRAREDPHRRIATHEGRTPQVMFG